ncbi:MAG: molybdopterin-dependent oxidoreductase [Acidobacteriaceae bacterium]|nr:molybdopterin-dependent oxidoreductase [Acidobacteriaceae bacterium]
MPHTLTTCTFCGVGCGLYLESADNRVVGAYPSVSHPTNAGRICLRGWHGQEIASSPDRLKYPLLRKNGNLEEASWDEAFAFIATRIREIRERYGPDALGFLNSPRCSNEDAYLLQKFARAVIGTNNVHHGTGVYCNNSINVLLEMLGVAASTNSIAELAQSDVILVDGVDLTRRMPTLGGAVLRAKLKGAKLIVVGTRRHRLVENADLFLQIRPNTETMLYGGIAKVIVDRGLVDGPFIRARCHNYEAFLQHIHQYDLLESAEACDVSAELIEEAAITYAKAKSAALLYSTSMQERTKDTIQAVVNLVLLTGNLGKPGAGLFALTEQNNLQGVCDMGMLPDRLPGYRPVTDNTARTELESLWKANLPAVPGIGSRRILANLQPGKIKGLWLCRYDPAGSSLFEVADSLRELEFIVVQHIFLTDTAQNYAHVVLPTTAFGEERVSFTNTERRIQLAEKVVEPFPGLSPAWEQLARLARLLGADWNYSSAAEVMEETRQAIPFYSGASHENLSREYGRQWPCTNDHPLGTQFLFGSPDHDTRFKFVPVPKTAPVPSVSKNYPLTLVCGSSLYYWNQNVLIRHSETLRREYSILLTDYPQGFVEIHPKDAQALKIRDGEQIRISSETGSGLSTARVTQEVRTGTVFVPYFERSLEHSILGQRRNGVTLISVRVKKEVA